MGQPHEYKVQIDGKTENVDKIIEERNKKEMLDALKKYMPIGSIVKIRGSFRKYMIAGFNSNIEKTIYDYLACEYPFGFDNHHENVRFNHDEIESVYHIGFINNQEKKFKEELLGDNER